MLVGRCSGTEDLSAPEISKLNGRITSFSASMPRNKLKGQDVMASMINTKTKTNKMGPRAAKIRNHLG